MHEIWLVDYQEYH